MKLFYILGLFYLLEECLNYKRIPVPHNPSTSIWGKERRPHTINFAKTTDRNKKLWLRGKQKSQIRGRGLDKEDLVQYTGGLLPEEFIDPSDPDENFEPDYSSVELVGKTSQSDDPATNVNYYMLPLKSYDNVVRLGSALGPMATRNFNRDGKITILVHGFTPGEEGNWTARIAGQRILEMAWDYRKRSSALNIYIVDWTNHSSHHWSQYWYSAEKVLPVAINMMNFFKPYIDEGWITSDRIHVVGNSLGAHIAGNFGLRLKRAGYDPIGRISGVDPAGPLFTKGTILYPISGAAFWDYKLAKTDADFVIFLHCDIHFYGTDLDLGHVNFYYNNGSQPTCSNDEFTGCSHGRCINIWRDSIRRLRKACIRPGCENIGVVPFGDRAVTKYTGVYYLDGPS